MQKWRWSHEQRAAKRVMMSQTFSKRMVMGTLGAGASGGLGIRHLEGLQGNATFSHSVYVSWGRGLSGAKASCPGQLAGLSMAQIPTGQGFFSNFKLYFPSRLHHFCQCPSPKDGDALGLSNCCSLPTRITGSSLLDQLQKLPSSSFHDAENSASLVLSDIVTQLEVLRAAQLHSPPQSNIGAPHLSPTEVTGLR